MKIVIYVLDKSKQSDELQRVPTCQSKLPAQHTGCFIGLIVNRRGEIDGVQMGVYVYRAK